MKSFSLRSASSGRASSFGRGRGAAVAARVRRTALPPRPGQVPAELRATRAPPARSSSSRSAPPARPVPALPRATPSSTSRRPRVPRVEPGRREELRSPYVADDKLDAPRMGARRARPRPAGADPPRSDCAGPLPGLRQGPERGAARARGGAGDRAGPRSRSYARSSERVDRPRRPERLEEPAVVGDEHDRSFVALERASSSSIASRSRWFVGSSRTSVFAPCAASSASVARVRSPGESERAGRVTSSAKSANFASSVRASPGASPSAP